MSQFRKRHIGPNSSDTQQMLKTLGYSSLDQLTQSVVPNSIADNASLKLSEAVTEEQALVELKALAEKNTVLTSLIGQGSMER